MTNRDYNNHDLGDIFEPTHRDGEPFFSFDPWALGGALFIAGLGVAGLIAIL